MKFYAMIFLVLGSMAMANAQTDKKATSRISGLIKEATANQILVYATLVLKDSNGRLVQGVISDDKGHYQFVDIPYGSYSLEVSYTGFVTHTQTVIVNQRTIDINTIVMKEDVEQLDAVVVTGEVSQMSLKMDKKVFRVGKDILSQSGSVSEVLENVPSVAVEPSGTVLLRGNSNVTILINGRRSGLSSAQALEQLPSENVDRIEVITTPSARYEASGSAGIINIILKKNIKGGLTGQLRAVVGIPDDYRLSGSFSYKTDKLNIFTNLGIRYTDYEGDYSKYQRTSNNGETIHLDQVQDQHRHDDGRWLYFGADYYFNERNTLTAAFYRNETEDTDVTDFIYEFRTNNGTIDSTLITDGNSKEHRSYNQLELNYTRQFEKEGRKLTFDMQYDFWDSEMTWDIRTRKAHPIITPLFSLRTVSDEKNNDLVLQTDFVTPFGKQSKLELGAKFENRHVKDDFRGEELIGDMFQLIEDLDNNLAYNERIFGAYVQYGNRIGKFNYLLGLRMEDTHIDIKDRNGVYAETYTYTNWFPTANFAYTLNEQVDLGLSYSKRINRPSLWHINPFSELDDFNARFFGNPNLRAAFTDAVELSLLKKGNVLTINPSIYYSRTTDKVQFYTTQNDTAIFETSPFNLEEELRYGVEVSTTYNPFKWLSLNANFNAYRFDQSGVYLGRSLDNADVTWFATLNSRFRVKGGWGFQARYNYQGRSSDAQSVQKAISYLNLGASKKLFHNKATLNLFVSNVFNTRKWRTAVTGSHFFVDETRSRNGARWSLSFTYRFDGKTGFKNRRANRSNRY